MKKRLRKKLGVGEFTEFGFEVRWQLVPGLPRAEVDCLHDAFIDVISGQGLYLWGWGEGERFTGFLNRAGRGSATEAHRQAVGTWLAERPQVARHEAGPLQDARRYGT